LRMKLSALFPTWCTLQDLESSRVLLENQNV
jgi:hypothetical protein